MSKARNISTKKTAVDNLRPVTVALLQQDINKAKKLLTTSPNLITDTDPFFLLNPVELCCSAGVPRSLKLLYKFTPPTLDQLDLILSYSSNMAKLSCIPVMCENGIDPNAKYWENNPRYADEESMAAPKELPVWNKIQCLYEDTLTMYVVKQFIKYGADFNTHPELWKGNARLEACINRGYKEVATIHQVKLNQEESANIAIQLV